MDKPSNRDYENIVSGAKISGTVYEKLNVKMKAKYKLSSSTSKTKRTATPPEGKK